MRPFIVSGFVVTGRPTPDDIVRENGARSVERGELVARRDGNEQLWQPPGRIMDLVLDPVVEHPVATSPHQHTRLDGHHCPWIGWEWQDLAGSEGRGVRSSVDEFQLDVRIVVQQGDNFSVRWGWAL